MNYELMDKIRSSLVLISEDLTIMFKPEIPHRNFLSEWFKDYFHDPFEKRSFYWVVEEEI